MEKKALKILLLLFVIPVIIGIIIAVSTGESYGPSNNYDSMSGRYDDEHRTYQEEVRGTSTFVYISVFALIVVSVGVWAYVKKKGEI